MTNIEGRRLQIGLTDGSLEPKGVPSKKRCEILRKMTQWLQDENEQKRPAGTCGRSFET